MKLLLEMLGMTNQCNMRCTYCDWNKINDGSELFGTSSGDGFKDLATYDEDENGWIDENDSIFSK